MNIMQDTCEYLVADVVVDKDNAITTVSLYPAKNTDLSKFNEKLSELLEAVTQGKNKKVLIMDDTNI